MKGLIIVRWNNAAVGLGLILASATPGSAAVRLVPAEYSTIQAAVDAAASNDVIQIAPGVYTNQVVITNKNLTLSGPGAVLRATPGMQQSLMSIVGTNAVVVPLVAVFESTHVVVSGLTLEGERLATNQPGPFIGILFRAAGGRVEDCRIMGFRGAKIDSMNGGFGVAITNPHRFGVGQINLDILRSTFADNATSILLKGDVPTAPPPNTNWNPGLLSTTFTVNDNIIVGNGPDDTGAQFGVWITAGAGGEVERNTITDHSFTGNYSTNNNSKWAFGVLANDGDDFGRTDLEALQPVHFEGNIFRNNQIHMALIRADGSTIVNNSFEGTAPGYRPVGLIFTGDGVRVATNRFSDMETGILLGGEDLVWDTYLGIATNAVLIANGFCNVATNFVYEPLTDYTEQDTQTCPPPFLDIRAVQLSWPYSDHGYSVQTAPSVSGLWTTSDATPFLQDGQNRVIIPADNDRHFFRLVKP
jgi:nitrous oxidase accessory protein NosD